jgi:hypothetical protein
MLFFKTYYSKNSTFSGLNVPSIGSSEVTTCDNSVFYRTHQEADRKGIILTVPFYGMDGCAAASRQLCERAPCGQCCPSRTLRS